MKSFSVEEIRDIRATYVHGKGNINIIELAKKYNVSQITIRKVAKGHTYGWVKWSMTIVAPNVGLL